MIPVNASTPELMPVNPLVNLVDVISSPRQAFQRIAAVQRGSWWLPALLCLAGALIYLIVALDATAAEAAKQIQIQMGTMIIQYKLEAPTMKPGTELRPQSM